MRLLRGLPPSDLCTAQRPPQYTIIYHISDITTCASLQDGYAAIHIAARGTFSDIVTALVTANADLELREPSIVRSCIAGRDVGEVPRQGLIPLSLSLAVALYLCNVHL